MVVDIYNTNKKYNIIYADPPWHYTGWRKGPRSVERHYPTMKVDKIIDMKDTIKSISDENCILFLWVTFPCLIEGLKVMKEWGFKYKTCGFQRCLQREEPPCGIPPQSAELAGRCGPR